MRIPSSAIRIRNALDVIRVIAVALLLLPFFSFPCRSQGALAIVDGTVVDPVLGKAPHSAIVIRDGRIVQVGPIDRITIPKDAQVIDAAGRWIVPGLIDAHVHFFQSGGLYTRPDILDLRRQRPYEEEVAAIRRALPGTLARYVANGITSVVDVGGPLWTFALRDSAARNPRAPEIAATGPLIATWAPEVLKNVEAPPMLVPHTPEEARALVRSILPFHPFAIKIWYIVRRGTSAGELLPIVSAAIDESHRNGVRVAVHATELETAKLAVQAGADILVHSVSDREVDDDFVRLLLARHVIYTPTLLVNQRYRELFAEGPALDTLERERGDPEVLRTLDSAPHMRRNLPKVRRAPDSITAANLTRLAAAGVVIAAGTDAGNIGTLHGPSLFIELEMMVEAGLSPTDVLRAVTIGGAELMGRENDLGSIKAGKVADLLILARDPLEGPRNLASAITVIHRGRIEPK